MEEKAWFQKEIEEVEKQLFTNRQTGLTKEQAEKSREQYGWNALKAGKKKSLVVKFLEQFKDFMIIILIIAAIVSGIVGYMEGEGFTDSIIILIVVIVNAVIGVAQEAKAEKSLEALQKLSSHSAKVVRDGTLSVVASKELVPGDKVVLETGDYVPADIRLVEAVNLKSQEASLTGESVPVEKCSGVIEGKVGIGDRKNMVFSSSLLTYGRGEGIVVATGMNTEVGKIAGILENTIQTQTPLQNKLNQLGKSLGIAAVLICIVLFVIGIAYGKDVIDMFMTAVSLAVAAIPEGLAAVSTIVLAIGVQKMVKRNAIVKKLPAVETLGSATVICSDKTGTLTQNKMTVQKVFVNEALETIEKVEPSAELEKIVQISMFCNDTKIGEEGALTGDPTETALIDMAMRLGKERKEMTTRERVQELPFDSERKLMTTVQHAENRYIVYTKGGVDELLSKCSAYLVNGKEEAFTKEYVEHIQQNNQKMAQEALRVLAMAYKYVDHIPTQEEMQEIEKELIFVGLVGMMDPPREEARVAVEKCKAAGIKTVMITGDHITTATAIAKQLGILETEEEAITGSRLEEMTQEELEKNVSYYSVYARVAPEHKVRIVSAWQANGQIVAMTGDGVNDAPALKKADIGCAMGVVGTDVAKEAADVILTDDNFATVVSAVEEGRKIYDNILKAIQFLLSSNVGEMIVLFIAILIAPILAAKFQIDVNLIVPLLPIHILWINLVTDSLPALALAVDPAEKDIMQRKPKKKQKGIFTKGMSWRVLYQGVMIGLLTLTAFIIGIATPNVPQIEGLTEKEVRVEIGQTMAFIVLAFSELVHVFNIRNNKESIFKTGIGGNKCLFGALGVSAAFMLVILLVPALRSVFSIPILPFGNMIEMLLLIVAPIVIVEIFKLFKINGKS